MTEQTERQAVHFAGELLRSLGLDSGMLNRAALAGTTRGRLDDLRGDRRLVKLRILSPTGEIIYSTVEDEVGRIHDQPSFRDHVRAGRVYSRVVRRGGRNAERRPVPGDVVETCVPVMVEGGFGGAVETYYDISGLQRIESIARRSSMLMWGISLSLLLAMTLVLRRTRSSIERGQQAEEALREANRSLEARAAERTAQLEEVNRWLKAEMTEHRRVREKVDSILRAVADGLLVLDADGRIVLMNEAAERLMRLAAKQAVGQRLEALRGGAAIVGQLPGSLQQADGSGEAMIETADPDDGTERHVRLRVSRAPGVGEGPDGQRVLLLQDVTSERRADVMKRDFLAMVAHELHTPLSAVIGYTELLAECTPNAYDEKKRAEFATRVHTMALNLTRMVDDLLDIGRIEGGHHLSLCKTDFALDELLRQLIRKYEGASRSHRFSLELPDAPVIFHGDPKRLEQVMENLLSNAVKYSPDGGEIKIEMQCREGECRVTISDQGIGMSREETEKAFDKFYRTEQASAAAQGSGLGMSVAKHIVESHGGEIWLTSRPGRGTRISFSLPRERRQRAVVLPGQTPLDPRASADSNPDFTHP